ncbi:MAG: C4-dicarboxylate ABC transporter [Oxalobacteraceae bacterium]|jgi:TRAP-type C4-dicarboxylate transport system substrate-binding protein|nr:MAG: C4-dicarboxylate ABC transporter [Oxalobacteraceae bacterium]
MNKCTTLLLRLSICLAFFIVIPADAARAASGPAAARPAAIDIDLATAYAADNFHTRNIEQFADDVRAASEGRVNIRVHAGGRLLKPTDIFSGVRNGKAEAGEVIMSSLQKEELLFGMDSLPFIVSGYDDAKRMWAAARPAVEQAMDKRDLMVLYAVPWPPQNLYSVEQVDTIRDFSGRAMRVYNPTTERIAELVGARTVAVQAVDLSKAISGKRVELMLTSSGTGVDTKAWRAMNYYYKVNAWLPKNMVFIRKEAFGRLTPADRKVMLDAARVAEARGWQLSQESDLGFEKQLAANRIKVAGMDFMIRSYLDRVGETVAREWLKKAGTTELQVLLKYTTERSLK